MPIQTLIRPHASALAYQTFALDSLPYPPVLFLSGFRSDMSGTKASYLKETLPARGQGLILFDYRGHGQSEGRFEDGTIGLWLADVLDVLDQLCPAPPIIVGSSMGGWLALLAARARPKKVRGIIGLASAPDFTRVIAESVNPDQKDQLHQNGFFMTMGVDGTRYPVTSAFLEDGEKHFLLSHGKPIEVSCPVRLIQGMKDDLVPPATAQMIFDALTTDDKQVYFQEEGDHRLSSHEDLTLLSGLISEVSGG
jgi:pimeloyl-ACP methyl ester carboxylesterase